MRKSVLVTGASSGIGLSTAREFLKNGFLVFAGLRHLRHGHELMEFATTLHFLDQLQLIELDVDNDHSVEQATHKISAATGQLDVVINNAGFGYLGASADMTVKEVKGQFETNFFGVHRVIKSMLPLIETVNGTIINISSISGHITFPLSGIYCASKHALEAYTESLWMELRPLGIHVYLVEPGAIATNFYRKGSKQANSQFFTTRYEKVRSVAPISQTGRTGWRSPPEEVARKIYWIANTKPHRLRHFVGRFSTILPLAHHMLPTEVFYWFLGRFF